MFSEVIVSARCPRCATRQEVDCQIRFGNLRGNVYRLGDQLEWGRPENGAPGMRRVAVLAWARCMHCQLEDWRLDVIVRDDVIRSVRSPSIVDYPEEGYSTPQPSAVGPTGETDVCPECGAADLSASYAPGVYESHCRACGLRTGGTVSYPVVGGELAQARLLVSCAASEPTANDLSSLRAIFDDLANENLSMLRARLAGKSSIALGPFSARSADALAAEAETAGLIVRVEQINPADDGAG
jgi:hypothetical protein